MLSTKINKVRKHACRACAHVCASDCGCFRVRNGGKRITSLGKLPPQCGIECTLLTETEAFLSALSSSGIEGKIVSVVVKQEQNNTSNKKTCKARLLCFHSHE